VRVSNLILGIAILVQDPEAVGAVALQLIYEAELPIEVSLHRLGRSVCALIRTFVVVDRAGCEARLDCLQRLPSSGPRVRASGEEVNGFGCGRGEIFPREVRSGFFGCCDDNRT
jgi:hypothetical protein